MFCQSKLLLTMHPQGCKLQPRASQKEHHVQSAAPKGQQQRALTIVRNFPTAVRSGIPHGEDSCCRRRVFQLFSPLWVSLEASDRFNLCVGHLALKHPETAAHVVEAPHGKNRHHYSHSPREKCLGNLDATLAKALARDPPVPTKHPRIPFMVPRNPMKGAEDAVCVD